MRYRRSSKEIRVLLRFVFGISSTSLLVAAMTMAPLADAAKSGEKSRVVNYRTVDRAAIENLQRWVAAGHEDWCKDARLVAAQELKRVASDFAGDATQLNEVNLVEGAGSSAKKIALEWTPFDGRATYRVTVERFEWLAPFAKDADEVVWVPTVTEIEIHE